MATYEHDSLMEIKDENGDKHIIYPITKAQNVDGLDEAINAGAGEVGDELANHLTDTEAHSALFVKKQDVLKGKRGKYVGFIEDNVAGEVDAPMSGGSHITMTFAADFEGCEWTLTGGDEIYTGTVDSSLTATVSVIGINTTYTLSAALSGTTYTAEVTTKDYYTALTVELKKFAATITVTIDSGSTVTATLGDTVLTRTSNGTAVFVVNKTGIWVIKAVLGNLEVENTVEITSNGQSKSLEMTYANVFGVVWDTSNSSTAITRLTPSTDPYGLVTQSVTTEPKPAVGTDAGSSPFDAYMPWNGMKMCNLDTSGNVTAWQDDSGFSWSSDYMMVYIPVFYVAAKRDGTKQYFYVSDKPRSGMVQHPGSGKYVGRYHMNGNGGSRSLYAPATKITRADARDIAKKNGSKFHLYDFVTYCALIFLYIIEIADWDCQRRIGKGAVLYSSGRLNSGATNTMNYHTGRANDNQDGYTSVQYRNIENLWGNVFQWIDGFNAFNSKAYYCSDPSKYAENTSNDYNDIGTLPTSGFIKDLTVTDDGLIIPKGSGGSDTTYIPDYVYSADGWRILCVGGDSTYGNNSGILCFLIDSTSINSSSAVSARLMCEA